MCVLEKERQVVQLRVVHDAEQKIMYQHDAHWYGSEERDCLDQNFEAAVAKLDLHDVGNRAMQHTINTNPVMQQPPTASMDRTKGEPHLK